MSADKKKEVCIVSDDDITSRLLLESIGASGFETNRIAFSKDEIEKVKESESTPHAVIYDVQHSNLANTCVCDFINEHLISKKIPRIIVSTFDIDCSNCIEMGKPRCAHFRKPWDRKVLLRKLVEFAS